MRDNATTEDELVHGYSGGPAPPPPPQLAYCACGTTIVCSPNDIPTGVLAHNLMPEHESWRSAGGMEASLERDGVYRSFDVPVRSDLSVPPTDGGE